MTKKKLKNQFTRKIYLHKLFDSFEYAILDKNVVIKKDVVVKGTPDNPVVIKKGDIITKDLIVE